MRRIVVIIPDLLCAPDDESPLRQSLPALSALAEIGKISKIARLPEIETPEALYLGMGPDEAQLSQGPLTVAALGADPPERSVQFHLSLLSHEDGVARTPTYLPTDADLEVIWPSIARLNTASLTVLRGEGLDHALVWEKLGEFRTTSAREVDGKHIRSYLPEGDGEKALRRLIDDSVNILTGLELNQRRLDEGLPPFNLLWPWGQGTRRKVPNLFLQRGERGFVESSSMRLAGLARLAGYAHGSRGGFGIGLNTRFRAVASLVKERAVSIVLFEAMQLLGGSEREEERHWLVREFDSAFLDPVRSFLPDQPTRLTLLAPSAAGIGLALLIDTSALASNPFPFDERTLEERGLPPSDLSRLVELGVTL